MRHSVPAGSAVFSQSGQTHRIHTTRTIQPNKNHLRPYEAISAHDSVNKLQLSGDKLIISITFTDTYRVYRYTEA